MSNNKYIFFLAALILNACGFKASSKGSNESGIISGIISPFAGLITRNSSLSFFFSDAIATNCASPVYAKLFRINIDGSIDDSNPLGSQLVGPDAKYSFSLEDIGIKNLTNNVQYLVKAEGCNGNVYKRPITSANNLQNIDAKTTVISDVVNTSGQVATKLNQVDRKQVESLINSIHGSTPNEAIASLKNDVNNSDKFNQIFGSSPDIIQNAHPEVSLTLPQTSLNELQPTPFTVQAFHIDPNYSFAFRWKVDGVVKSSSNTFNYIAGANDQGTHQIDLYVGMSDGSGNIDLTKPYYNKTFSITVNNNVLPVTPNFSLSSNFLSPVNTSTVQVDINTGVSFDKCASFSHLAITDTATPPGIMQFNIDCNFSGTQTETVTYSSGDGAKTLYLWSIDNEGIIGSPKTISLVLDTQPPTASINFSSSAVQGGSAQAITLSATDTGVGLKSVDLYLSTNGGVNYSLLSHLSATATTYNWSVPMIDTVNAKIKLVATDLTSSTTTVYTPTFEIDSLAPTAPSINRGNSFTSTRSVVINTVCSSDYDKILYSQANTTPATNDGAWETCSSTKNFSVTSGDGEKLIYAFTKDAVGNISSSSSLSIFLDTTLPNITLTGFNPGTVYKGGSIQSINWQADDINLTTNPVSISYSTNGLTFTTIASGLTNSGSYSWNLPSLDSSSITLKLSAIDLAGNLKTVNSSSFTIDSTSPTLTINDPSGIQRGGNQLTLNYAASDLNSISSLKLYYAADGITFGSSTDLPLGSISFSWTVPAINVTTAKLKLVATDSAGNSATAVTNAFSIDSTPPTTPTIARTSSAISNSNSVNISINCIADYDKVLFSQTNTTPVIDDSSWTNCSNTKSFTVSNGDGVKTIFAFTKDSVGNISTSANISMTLDTTPPAAPVANLATSTISSSSIIAFTVPDCLDRPYILISESILAPEISDSNWQACSTASAAMTYTLIGPALQGAHTLYLYAKDSAGNISASTSASMIYDTTNPTLNLSTSLGLLYKGGDTIALNYSASDSNGISSLKLYYSNDGTIYSLVSTLPSSGTTYSWIVPSANTANAKLKLVAVDNAVAANTSISYSTEFAIDSTPPAPPTITRTSNAISNSSSVTATIGNCTDTTWIFLTESNTAPTDASSGWQLCSTAANAYVATVSGEGNHTLNAWAKDAVGNISTSASSIAMTLDTTAPTITVTSPSYLQGNVNTASFSWTLTEANIPVNAKFLVELFNGTAWSTIGNVNANSGVNTNQPYSLSGITVPGVDTLNAKLRITFTDAAGLQTQIESETFPIASTSPSISLLQINSGAASTTSSYVALSLSATSPIANITQFCFKITSTTPPLNDTCWTALNSPQPNISPSLNISFSNYNYLLSFTPGPYNVYGWVRDMAGNISSSATASIVVQTPTPPSISNVIIANSSNPSDPILATDKTFNGSQPAYIKWKVTSSSSATISLSYQTNSGTTTIASGLTNGSNSGCTVNDTTTADDQDTGCFVWNGAPSQYFVVTVKATDANNVSAQTSSYPLNATSINFIAGKTDLGLGTSATSAMLKIATSWSDVGTLAVTTDGRIFMRDRTLGLVMVDPKDGILKLVAPITGTASGDGGSVANASLCAAQKIALDFQDRLLIFDCTKIRRINTASNPMTIDTIIGGGASQADATPALSFQIVTPGTADGPYSPKTIPFFSLPNGDIYFLSSAYNSTISAGYQIRKYKAADGKVYALSPSGTGDSENSTLDIRTASAYGFGVVYNPLNSEISNALLQLNQTYVGDGGFAYTNLDPTTFISTAPHPMKSSRNDYFIQGMNGKLYVHDGRTGLLRRFNETTGTYTTIVGGGSNTSCPDGTLATACKVNNGFSGFDAFISATGQIYFVDYVGIVRTVLTDGTVRRVMGQAKGAGDNGAAVEARTNTVNWADQANDGTIFFSDSVENRIRKFTIDGNITAHANNLTEANFLLNKSTNDIYARSGNAGNKLTYSTATWSTIATLSTTYNSVSNGLNEIYGYDSNSTLLYGIQPAWDPTLGYRDYKLASYNWATPAISVLTNYSGTTSAYCANNTAASACSVSSGGNARAQYDTLQVTPRWIMLQAGTNRIVALNKGGQNTSEVLITVATLPKTANSFVYRKVSGTELIDYCATDGKLYSYNITTSTNSAYNWPIANLTCNGRTLNYNSSRDSLIFPARQNGLSAIIEYKLTP